jgi:hypothetical protein
MLKQLIFYTDSYIVLTPFMKRALLVGIDDYPGSPLAGCVIDARAMRDMLCRNADGSTNFDCRLLIPVGENHMFYAAINSKSCQLTPLGRFYWKLVKENRL